MDRFAIVVQGSRITLHTEEGVSFIGYPIRDRLALLDLDNLNVFFDHNVLKFDDRKRCFSYDLDTQIWDEQVREEENL